MKIINSIVGFIIIFIGCFFMTITIEHESFQTLIYKFLGAFIIIGGLHYLKKVSNFGKQR
ncbi:hypothetical protein CSE16_03570 [Solibacillus sp. R5-41]|uniref:hypothetical protein n=1 Tax=Solibacillus sp. R5-41 TaxID=2048654 RepID=UPI000C12525F|nr:hypothetical protein [Solibacillus sp. R5-41]ATP39183.1 hypothetical protein CSE16_03570 [Solibacillus sp. R5-41]